MENKNITNKKPSHRKYKIVIVLFTILFIAFLVSFPLVIKSMYPSKSDIVIKQVIAEQLNKDPNKLTKDDFAQIIQLNLSLKELSDIRYLKKLINLQELYMSGTRVPKYTLPKWKQILQRLLLINHSENEFIDLRPLIELSNLKMIYINGKGFNDFTPLAKLTHLQHLTLSYTEFDDIDSLSSLNNIKELGLSGTPISDFNSLNKFKNLESLYVFDTQFSNLKLIKNLTNLQTLGLSRSKVTDLNPIKIFEKLEWLGLDENQASDLKPLLELKNLKTLSILGNTSDFSAALLNVIPNWIIDLESIKKMKNLEKFYLHNVLLSDEQQKELKKANPDLEVGLGYSS